MISRITLLAFGFALILGCHSKLDTTKSQSPSSNSTLTVLVARQSIPSWLPLTRELVEWRECEATEVPVDAIRLREQLGPCAVVRWGEDYLRYPIYQGTPIRQTDIAHGPPPNSGGTMARGYQLFAIEVRDDSIGKSLNTASSVDIEVLLTDPDTLATLSETQPFYRTILRKIRVYKIDQQPDYLAIHLLIRPDQAEKILLAKRLGEVGLASVSRNGGASLDQTSILTSEPDETKPTLTQTISVQTHPRAD